MTMLAPMSAAWNGGRKGLDAAQPPTRWPRPRRRGHGPARGPGVHRSAGGGAHQFLTNVVIPWLRRTAQACAGRQGPQTDRAGPATVSAGLRRLQPAADVPGPARAGRPGPRAGRAGAGRGHAARPDLPDAAPDPAPGEVEPETLRPALGHACRPGGDPRTPAGGGWVAVGAAVTDVRTAYLS